MYTEGEGGVAKDRAKALYWLREATLSGVEDAWGEILSWFGDDEDIDEASFMLSEMKGRFPLNMASLPASLT
jgi:TPR repeat protein